MAGASEHTKEQFDRTIRSHVQGDGYHALLLLSGGKDSAYILDRLRTEYAGLKILCLTVDNGFMSPFAIKSATFVAGKLKTDLLIASHCVDEFAKVLRGAFIALKGRGSYGVIDFADGELIFEIGKRVARQLKIPLIFGGLSWVQVQRIVGSDGYELYNPPDPRIIFPLAVWKTSETEIRKYVRSANLLPRGSESPIVSNSSLILAMSAVDVKNLGYCSFEPEFAQLVREGKADRRTWLHLFESLEFAASNGFLDKEINKTLRGLDLTLADVIRNS